MNTRWVKGIVTVCGAILLSTLGIFASDRLQGVDTQLGSLSKTQKDSICKQDSVPIRIDDRTICVDLYEASPGDKCPHPELANHIQSEKNATTKDCFAVSAVHAVPWNFISLAQAQRMCASAGKRLPTSKEWYRFALGTDPEACTIQAERAGETGTDTCVSSSGVYDSIGNVWEWVDENITGSTFHDRTLPEEGYVTAVDADGVALTSSLIGDELYGKDYFWSKNEGVFGMIRGGFYGSNQDAGLYTINASVPTSFASQGVGFRCVEDVF